jgi:tetratricopeptide (TPR) repeat protein
MTKNIQSVKKLIHISKDDLSLLVETGYFLGNLRRYQAAEKVFRGVLAVAPDLEAAQIGLGNIRLLLGDKTEAESIYSDLVKTNPNSPVAHAYYGELLLGFRRDEEALLHLNRAIALDRSGSAAKMARNLLKLHETGIFSASAQVKP